MYELPADFDLQQFVGTSLEAIVFGAYKVDLLLSQGYRLGIESELSIDSGEPVELPQILTLLYPLINQDISAVGRTKTNQLDLTFEQGTVLHIHGSNTMYECYSIEHKGQTLAIV